MSITINQSPSDYPSAHHELWHVVDSTNKNTAGFQYVFDIYKGATLLTRVKNSPIAPDNKGVLDVCNIVRSLLPGTDFPDRSLDDFQLNNMLGVDVFFADYDVRYGHVSGGVLTANIASGRYRVYNNYKRKGWDNKQSNISVSGQILTNRPSTSYYYEGQPVVICYFGETGQNYSKTYANLSADPYTGNGRAVITSWVPTTDSTFQVSGSVGGVIGTRSLRKRCAKHKTHTLIFRNAFGVWDSFTFVHGKLISDIQRKQYNRQNWQLVGSSMQENNGRVFYEKQWTYDIEYGSKMVLTSDILSTDEYDWLFELVASTQVYYVGGNIDKLYPVTITDNNYEFKQDAIEKTDTLQVTIQFDKNNTQYR